MHHGDGSNKEEAKELCHQMLVLGLLQPFSELQGDSAVSAGVNVRAFSSLSVITLIFPKKTWAALHQFGLKLN